MIKELLQAIDKYNTIIIHRHSRPDLDALGSQRGLALAIKEKYPKKNVYMVGDMSDRYSFLGQMDEISDDKYNDALSIICDVAVSKMVSDDRYTLAKEVYVIDHHTNLSDIENAKLIIDPSYSACAEEIAEILYDNGFAVSPSSATALYGGIVTDSGRFQYSSTTSRTFKIAAKLLESGADMQFIYDNIYVDDLASKRMKNYFANKFELTENNVAYLKNDVDVFEKFPVDFFTISRGMVGVMAGIREISIWCNFTIDTVNNKIIGEFRSRGIKIVDIAKKYGGGGHDEACGATLDSWEMVDSILKEFDTLAKENKK